MRTMTEEKLANRYLIYKDLTPEKRYKTYIAMKKHSDGSIFPIILKEMDKKRADIYCALSHMWNPFLANTYDIFKVTNTADPEQERYIAVTGYVHADGCSDEECLSLTQFVRKNGPLKEKTALSICTQICDGLADFHKNGFVHRDLKPDNIMISKYDIEQPQIKIIDFGGAKRMDFYKYSDTTVIGTLGYQAPESLSSTTTKQADIYSISCILNFMLTGQEPGLSRYQGNHYIVSIIEKATSDDPYSRYKSVISLQKQLKHESGVRAIDRIPVLRAVPGFRTNTIWKESVAVISYNFMIFFSIFQLDKYGFLNMIQSILFYFAVPLIMGFNMGNLLRFFPDRLRRNTTSFGFLRTVIIIVCIFIPSVIEQF